MAPDPKKVAELDAKIIAEALEEDTTDTDLALLWAAKAYHLEVPFMTEMLPLLIGCTLERAYEIQAEFIESGLLNLREIDVIPLDMPEPPE